MIRTSIFTTLFILGITAQAMDYTNGYALETKDGTNVGFILGSPSFKVEAGDCVFMFLPQKPEAANSALGLAVSELKAAGEHAWKKSGDAILIQNGSQTLLTISASAEIVDRNGAIIGNAIAMPERK